MNKVLGGCMLGAGILIAGLSGLCSLMLILSEMPLSARDLSDGLPVVLVVGGVPFLVGIGLVFLGRFVIRQDYSSPPNPSPPTPAPAPDREPGP
jgi:hypothetical protein